MILPIAVFTGAILLPLVAFAAVASLVRDLAIVSSLIARGAL